MWFCFDEALILMDYPEHADCLAGSAIPLLQ